MTYNLTSTTIQTDNSNISINVPLRLKKRGGRKEVVIPDDNVNVNMGTDMHKDALIIALARAHRWQRLLDEGKFESISDIARAVGLNVSFVARLMKLTLLAPDIVESILRGEEPDGFSLSMMKKELPVIWEEQRGYLCIS